MKSYLSLSACIVLPLICGTSAHAAIVYSGPQEISISQDFASVYVDVDSGSSTPTVGSGWDIDTFFGGEAFGNSANFQPVRQTVDITSAIVRLEQGVSVSASNTYANTAAGSSTHIGSGPAQFASGLTGYLGFRMIDNQGAGPFFGWMQVNFSNTGDPGRIIDWAYDNTGAAATVGLVPEPTTVGLLGIGSLALAFRRRRDTARV